MRIAFIVNGEKLLGVISDADIRRAMLKKVSLSCEINDIYNKKPLTCYIDDTKEAIIQKAVNRGVYEIPIIDKNNNLVGIETLTHLLKHKTHTNKVVLMVGGLGKRLQPLTANTPKPLLKVGNKPILESIIENFSKYGFKDFILSVNYKSEMIEEYFGNGDKFNVSIQYIYEDKRLGTAGALSLMHDYLSEDFFVMNGDLLTNINFEYLKDFHIKNNAVATMCVRKYDMEVPYGVVNIDNNKIISIEEKPTHSFFVNAGIYMLSPTVIKNIPKNEFYDMPTLFDKLINSNENTISFPMHEYWLDIGRIEEFEKANNEYHKIF